MCANDEIHCPMNLRLPITTLLMFLIACEPANQQEQLPTQQPNIIYIMADDHAFQAISAYGFDLIETPHIDRLAKEGMLFTQSFVTNSICGPSRATLLTGKFSHENGFYGNGDRFNPDQPTFPGMLQQAGYQTAMIGKWHLYTEPRGFDYWRILPGQGHYYNPDFIHMEGDTIRHQGYVTKLITDFALDFLENRDTDKPFCMLYHHKAPHRRWFPDSSQFDLFDDKTFDIPETFFDEYADRQAAKEQEMTVATHMDLSGDLKLAPEFAEGRPTNYPSGARGLKNELGRMNEAQRAAWEEEYQPYGEEFKSQFDPAEEVSKELAEWKLQRYLMDYLRCVASVDEQVGRVLDYLDEQGLAENTIVVYTSDQGFYLGEHGWFDKRFMYEESFRMPLIARYPGVIPAGSTNDQLVQNLDFAPTFLDLAGMDVPSDMQGRSLLPILRGNEQAEWRDALYYHYYGYPDVHMVKRHYGIRTNQHKLIHFYHDIDQWELFDLDKDPLEVHNMIDDPGYTEIKKQLMEKLTALRTAYNVPEDEIVAEN